MIAPRRQPRVGAATLGACVLAAGLILGDQSGAAGGAVSSWAAVASALVAVWAALRAFTRRRAGGSDPLGAALVVVGLLLAGVARGSACARAAETQLELGAACEGLAWVRGDLRLESGGCVLAVRELRRAGAGAPDGLPEPLQVALPRTPGEALEEGASRGATFEGFVRLRSARGPTGPGAADERALLRAAGRGASGWTLLGHVGPSAGVRPGPLESLRRAVRPSLARLGDRLRRRVAAAIGGAPGAFAACFLLGQAGGAQVAPAHAFALWRCGASHVLAVSGLHVGMVAVLVHTLLGTLPLGPRSRWLALAGALALYAALIGPCVSVTRAATVGVAWAGLRAAGRLPRGRTLLLAAAAAGLWASPGASRLPGWRLTYLVSLSLVGIASGRGGPGAGRRRRPHGRGGQRRAAVGRGLAGGATALAAAQAAAWPLVLGHFGWASPFFLVSNAVLIPLCGLLMPVVWGSLGLAAAPGFPGPLAAGPCALAIRGYLALAGWLGRLCDTWIVGCGPPAPAALAASLGVAAVCNVTCVSRRLRLGIAVGLAGAFTVIALAREPEPRLLALDVGQGECWVLAWRQETWVVDLGPQPATAGRARWAVARALRRLGRARVDRLVLTHADSDHTGGLEELLAAGVPVGVLHHPQGWRPEGWLAGAVHELEHRGTRRQPLVAGETLLACGVRCRVLNPPSGMLEAGAGDNEGCLALRLEVGDLPLILAGDAPAEVELSWARAGANLRARVLSAAHHGSRGSTPVELLEATGARLLVISAGRGNHFGHPHAEVLERAASLGVEVFRTDRDGSVLVGRAPAGWFARAWTDGRTLAL